MPEQDKLLLAGYELVHWEHESDVLTLCTSCYESKYLDYKKTYHTIPLFRSEVSPKDRCNVCKKPLI